MMKSRSIFKRFRRLFSLKANLSFILLGVLVVSFACTPRPSISKPPLEDRGEVILYLQPLPQDAHRFRFTVSAILAVSSDGKTYPLSLDFMEVRGAEMVKEQSRLASAVLPPGMYTGFLLSIGEAMVQTEEGEVALFVPEEPVRVNHEFKVDRRQALALFFSFDPEMSLTGGFRFSPEFTVKTFSRQLINLIGYVSNSKANNVTVFNKGTMEVTNIIATRQGPHGIVIDEAGQVVYVALSGSDLIEVIDMTLRNVYTTITLNPGDEPKDLALSPDGETLVVINPGSRTLSVIDTGSKFELRRFVVGEEPTSVVLDRKGVTAYVLNSLSNTISAVEISKDHEPFTIGVEAIPFRGDFNRSGDRLYVITQDSPNLIVIDVSSLSVVGKIFVGNGARSIKVDTRTELIYVGMNSGAIHVVDPRSLMFSDVIPCGGGIENMTIDNDENVLFALVPERKKLLKINMISKRVLSELPVEGGAYEVAVMRER